MGDSKEAIKIDRTGTPEEKAVLSKFLYDGIVPQHIDFESALWGACTAMLELRSGKLITKVTDV